MPLVDILFKKTFASYDFTRTENKFIIIEYNNNLLKMYHGRLCQPQQTLPKVYPSEINNFK